MDDAYIPSEMSVKALQIGYLKSLETSKLLDEELITSAENALTKCLKSIWTRVPEDYVMSYDDALLTLTLDKSPGYPYFYQHQTKGEVLEENPGLVKERVNRLMKGERVPCVFAFTEKSELRDRVKVREKKTRIFAASDLHHLLACTQLYELQNLALMETQGQHPITIGIQMPGPEFVNALTGLVSKTGLANDGDMSGCDQRFPCRIARSVRDIRHKFLPPRYNAAGKHIYNTVYAGVAVVLGGAYRAYGNKSGWKNTGHDNSLQLWLCLIMASYALYPTKEWYQVWKGLINGDDLIVSMLDSGFSFFEICAWLKAHVGVWIESSEWLPRPVTDCVYLSHHLEYRYVQGFGDFLVAAGNLPKLLSSVNWVKTNPNLTYEESCVAHLVGIRMCLFPWQLEFEEIDALLSRYLDQIHRTDFVKDVLIARFNERELARMHTRVESFSFFFSRLNPLVYQVLKGQFRLIKESIRNDTHSNSEGKACSR